MKKKAARYLISEFTMIILSLKSGVPMKKLKTGSLTSDDFRKIFEAAADLQEFGIQ